MCKTQCKQISAGLVLYTCSVHYCTYCTCTSAQNRFLTFTPGPVHSDGSSLRLLGSQRGRGGREEGPGDDDDDDYYDYEDD